MNNKKNGLLQLIRILTISFCVSALAACGGGGGGDGSTGGGGGGGGSGSGGTTLQLSTSAVAFTAFANDPSADSKTIQVTWTGSNVAGYAVGTLPGQTLPSWLSVSGPGAASSPSTLTISRVAPGLPVGHYSTTLRVVTGDVNQNVLNTADFTVALDVFNAPTIAPSAVSFTWEESTQPAAQTLAVTHDASVQLQSAVVSGVNWLDATMSGDTITLSPNAQAQQRAPGPQSGTLTATFSLNGTQRTISVGISSSVTARGNAGLQLSASSVPFAMFTGTAATEAKPLQVSWTDSRVVGYVVGTLPGQTLPPWLSVSAPGSPSSSPFTITRTLASLAIGHYSTTLRVAIGDANQTVFATADVAVTLDVVNRPTIAPQSVALTWVESEQPAARTFTVTRDSLVQFTGTSLDVNWLTAGTSGDTVTLSGNALSKLMGQGTSSGTLTASFSLGGDQMTLSVPISATVTRALSSSTTLLTLQVNASTVSADLSASRITVTSATTTPVTLSAQSNVPWLSVTGGSSASANNIALTIDSTKLGAMANGVYHATITASATNVTPLAISVDLNLRLPEVRFVAPVAFTDTVASEAVIVRGQGFNDPGVQFQLAGVAVTGGTKVSDTEFRFIPGARAAGDYTVQAPNHLGIARSTAPLRVTAPPAYTNFTLSAPYGAPERVISSPINSAVFADRCYFCAVNTPTGYESNVFRYAYDSGSGAWSVTPFDYPGLYDIALSPDESKLIVLTNGQLLIVNPQSMVTLEVINLSNFPGGTSRELAVLNNGLVIIGSMGSAYDLVTKTFVLIDNLASDQMEASRDGSRAMNGASTNSGAYRYFDATTGSVVITNTFQHFSRGSYSRHATRAFVNGNLFDKDLVLLGALPNAVVSHSGVVSPDGTRLYGIDLGITNNTNNLRTFDITGLAPFTELAPASVPITGIARMEVDPRGNAVFVIDDASFRVIDLP